MHQRYVGSAELIQISEEVKIMLWDMSHSLEVTSWFAIAQGGFDVSGFGCP